MKRLRQHWLLGRSGCIIAGVALAVAMACASVAYASASGKVAPPPYIQKGASVPAAIGNPYTAAAKKQLCSGGMRKVGLEVYSETQEFAAAQNAAIMKLAKHLGCVQIVMLTDNNDGPTAVNNVRTMILQGIQGLMNDQGVASSQIAIAALANKAKIPVEVSGGPSETGAPYVNISHYTAGYDAGMMLAQAAKKKYPKDTQPYLINGVDEMGGPSQEQQGIGTTTAIKKEFPGIPKSHLIDIDEDGTGPVAYNASLSALSRVPSNGLVLMTSTDSDTVNGQYQAAQSRHWKSFIVADAAGASLGLKNVCKFSQYAGSVDYYPANWGLYMLPSVLEMINGKKLPSTITIPVVNVTKTNGRDPYCK